MLELVSRHESNPLSVYRPRQATRWWAHLVGALRVHPHKHCANFPPQKDRRNASAAARRRHEWGSAVVILTCERSRGEWSRHVPRFRPGRVAPRRRRKRCRKPMVVHVDLRALTGGPERARCLKLRSNLTSRFIERISLGAEGCVSEFERAARLYCEAQVSRHEPIEGHIDAHLIVTALRHVAEKSRNTNSCRSPVGGLLVGA